MTHAQFLFERHFHVLVAFQELDKTWSRQGVVLTIQFAKMSSLLEQILSRLETVRLNGHEMNAHLAMNGG